MMKILLAEDEKSLSRASQRILERYGYQVTPAYDGEEALEKLKHEYFDLVLLDVMMPKKNGLEVLSELKEIGNEAKIIMLTAKSEIQDKVEGLTAGADDYITKPFDYNELHARIQVIERSLKKEEKYEIDELILDVPKRMLYNKHQQDNGCILTPEEIRIVKLFRKETCVSKNILLTIFEENHEKLTLYIKYLNNKMNSLATNLRLIQNETNVQLQKEG